MTQLRRGMWSCWCLFSMQKIRICVLLLLCVVWEHHQPCWSIRCSPDCSCCLLMSKFAVELRHWFSAEHPESIWIAKEENGGQSYSATSFCSQSHKEHNWPQAGCVILLQQGSVCSDECLWFALFNMCSSEYIFLKGNTKHILHLRRELSLAYRSIEFLRASLGSCCFSFLGLLLRHMART